MEKLGKEDGQSMDIVESNIAQLKEIFPDVFPEGKIDFDKLQALLGNYVNTDEDHYNFTWHGKRRAARLAQTPSTGTLRPCKEESIDWDTTQNLFIEGDNLEVLKLLQKSYHRQVKMIYIDPPYNKDKDFLYKDTWSDSISNYLEYTKQLDSEGNKISTSIELSGRRHTNWLNMIYPRLKLARNLLRDDGLIFISIDEDELTNMKSVCNQIFGEENQLVSMIWELPRGINAGHISKSHEYVLAYAKSKDKLKQFFKTGEAEFSVDRCNKKIDARHPASKITFPAGIRYEGKDQKFVGSIEGAEEIIIHGELEFIGGTLYKEVTLEAGWTMREMISKWMRGEEVYDTKGQKIVEFFFKENGRLYSKKIPEFQSVKSILKGFGDYQEGRLELEELFGSQDVFEYPKPSKLIKYLCSLTTQNDLILDFFGGSCPTGQAIYDLNELDGLNRRFILVQIPERIKSDTEAFKLGFHNISDLGKERIRRSSRKIKSKNPMFAGDLGFKVFKLDTSNIKPWDAGFETLENDLIGAVDYIKQDRTNEDVLYELLLKYGLDLTVPIETRTIGGKTIYSIGMGALIVCLDKDVSMETVEGIGKLKEELSPEIMRVVFKDNGFKDDVVKTNAIQTLKRFGIEDIKSL